LYKIFPLVSKRYNNPRIIATRHAKALLNAPKVKTGSANEHRNGIRNSKY
jgi:hypothetical protein